MSGGHWDYRHGSAANDVEGGVGTYFITEVVDEVKRDIANLTSGEFSEYRPATPDERATVSAGIVYLELIVPEIEALRAQLAALVGHDSKVYEIIDALDRLYAGDIGVDTLVYRINKALGGGK